MIKINSSNTIDEMPKVSVIVPIYNVERYIEKSVTSLMEQTLENIEYIFVNDCTPEASMEILDYVIDKYPNRKTQIKIVNQPYNQGLAAARTKGLELATGQYIIHIDSDDYCEIEMIEQLYNKAVKENADIVVCDYFVNYKKKQVYVRQIAPNKGLECMKALMRAELHGANWNKLIARKLYSENNINYISGIDMWEDLSTVFRLFYFANKVAYLPKAFLHYVQQREESYTACPSLQSLENMAQAITVMEEFLIEHNEIQHFQRELCLQKLNAKCEWLKYSRGAKQKELSYLYPEADQYIMDNHSNPIYYRYAQLFASKKIFWLANVILNLVFLLKHIIRK